jgi:uncharacterized protein (UPF0262 family)
MADPRIIDIELDERSILKRNADIEQERRIAIFDLLEKNQFDVAGHEGPYRVKLRVEEGRLAIELLGEDGGPYETIRMALGRFRRPVRDYFAICESYFRAVRNDGAKGIEAIDMARRALHNEAAELLQECLEGKVGMDFDTARRLFTLLCVLHIKQPTTAVDLARHPHESRTG